MFCYQFELLLTVAFSRFQTDVSGVCPTEYAVKTNSYGSTLISKSKNLSGCKERHMTKTTLETVPFHTDKVGDILSLLCF